LSILVDAQVQGKKDREKNIDRKRRQKKGDIDKRERSRQTDRKT
jgi:hypothetical protein